MDAGRSGFEDTTSIDAGEASPHPAFGSLLPRGAAEKALVIAFLASAIGTVYLCRSMGASMPMPGGWSMSMAWMRMPGQSWAGGLAMFVAMWTVMMIAMMLPAVAPMIRTAATGFGYFAVWTAIGIAIYPLGVAFATAAMRAPALARATPVLAALVLAGGGVVQCTRWKARQLECCRTRCDASLGGGVRLGVRCAICCLPFMSAFLAAGVMNLAAMALAAAAIAIERYAPHPERISRAIGAALIVAGGVYWI